MAELKLNRLDLGDDQITLTDKINGNFSTLVNYLGGPNGINGNPGEYGLEGDIGSNGSKGPRGSRGSIWFFSNDTPATGSYIPGDYWVDFTEKNSVYKLSGSYSWEYQNLNLGASDYFKRISDINGFTNKDAIIQSGSNPENNTFVLNSIFPETTKLNPQYSRFLIETNPGATAPYSLLDQPIIEFDKATNGGTGNSEITPILKWDGANIGLTGANKGITWNIRQGGFVMDFGGNIDIKSGPGSAYLKFITYDSRSSINAGNITFNASGNITIKDKTASKGKISISTPSFSMGSGTNKDSSSLDGKLEVNKSLVGNSLPALIISNDSNNNGGAFSASVNTASGNGMYWKNTINSEDLITLPRYLTSSDFRVNRQMSISNKSTPTSTAHGPYSGVSVYWNGIFPNGDGGAVTEKISWYGESEITITPSGTNRGIYINTHYLMDYIEENSSISLSCDLRGNDIKAIGIGNYTSGVAWPAIGTASQYKVFMGTLPRSIDMHFVPETGATGGGGYTMYYEAYGATGGIQSGVLY